MEMLNRRKGPRITGAQDARVRPRVTERFYSYSSSSSNIIISIHPIITAVAADRFALVRFYLLSSQKQIVGFLVTSRKIEILNKYVKSMSEHMMVCCHGSSITLARVPDLFCSGMSAHHPRFGVTGGESE